MKKKKHKLSYTLDFNFYLFGISSSENDYRLSWKINNKLKIGLRKSPDHIINKKDIKQRFLVFTYSDNEMYIQYFLIGNKSEKGYLIEELRNIDFFMKIHGELTENQQEKIVNSIKNITGVSGIFKLDINKLKSRQNLIIE